MATRQEVEEMYNFIINNISNIHLSPYSNSFYDRAVDWGDKEEGTIRVSDHWNWYDKDGVHCPTHQEIKSGYVSIGIMQNGKFDIVKSVYRYDANNYEGKWEEIVRKNHLFILPNENEIILSDEYILEDLKEKDHGAFRLLVGTD